MTAVTSYDPRTGEPVWTADGTTPEELRAVVGAAASAAQAVAAATSTERRDWLVGVADALVAHQDELVALADRETALGTTRLVGELTRAANQLRFYGDVAVEGSYLEVTIDEATTTTPRLVRVNRPLGPVAVFGASNFPFAFSVLGNDTGAALAAGCPVVAKAHPAHAALSHRQAEIAQRSLAEAGAPEGAFGLVDGHQAGVDLVRAAAISAVAFTGSQSGGMALWRLANEREVVIPVYAEMGTVNPVVLTRAGARRMDTVAAGLVGSFTLGHGQFCTKPGLLLAPAGSGAAEAVAAALRDAAPSPVMLTESIASSVRDGLAAMQAAGARLVERLDPEAPGWAAPAAVLRADVSALRAGSRLLEECFGAVLLVCEYDGDEQLAEALATLQGSLAASLVDRRRRRSAGPRGARSPERKGRSRRRRRLAHGRRLHLGAAARRALAVDDRALRDLGRGAGLARFVRPVAFQSAHDGWLPPEARAENPWRLPRRVNGAPEHAGPTPR